MAKEPANSNLLLWNALAPVDRKFTKPITGKSYKGDSPNPTYVILKLTEQFGPIGKEWGFNVKWDNIRYGKPHQIVTETVVEMQPAPETAPPDYQARAKSKTTRYEIVREEYHEICITFWFQQDDGRRTFDAIGGTPMLYVAKSGSWIHDEDAAKKSLTDAYTKGASWLGACADIFLGLFDDKYTPPKDDDLAKKEPSQPPADGHDKASGTNTPEKDTAPSGDRKNTAPEGW